MVPERFLGKSFAVPNSRRNDMYMYAWCATGLGGIHKDTVLKQKTLVYLFFMQNIKQKVLFVCLIHARFWCGCQPRCVTANQDCKVDLLWKGKRFTGGTIKAGAKKQWRVKNKRGGSASVIVKSTNDIILSVANSNGVDCPSLPHQEVQVSQSKPHFVPY